jgi:hypothetical protein
MALTDPSLSSQLASQLTGKGFGHLPLYPHTPPLSPDVTAFTQLSGGAKERLGELTVSQFKNIKMIL